MKRMIWFSLLILILMMFFNSFREVPNVHSQVLIQCSDLETIFSDTSGNADTKPAAIVTDPSGAAHLFWLNQQNRNDTSTWSIYYSHWQDGQWSAPTDVLITPGGGAGAPRVVYHPEGRLQVIWGDQRNLWHSSAYANQANSAQFWSKPELIASEVIDYDIAVNLTGVLHVVYANGKPAGPLFYLNSIDGKFWSQPIPILISSPLEVTPNIPRISIDGKGRIHVVWTEYQLPGGWPPTGFKYIQSEDSGFTWVNELPLGIGEQGQGTVLAVGDDQIHIVWRGSSAAGNSYHQYSADGGKSWIGPEIFDPDGGFSGGQSLALDSAGNIHLVRSDGGYQIWKNGLWSPVPALFADSGEIGTLAIGLGNQVHWVNTTPASDKNGFVWHRLCVSDSPSISSQMIPTKNPDNLPNVTSTYQFESSASQLSNTSIPEFSRDINPPSSIGGPILFGAGFVIVFITLVFIINFYIGRNR